jgi:rhamnose transport system permease protein
MIDVRERSVAIAIVVLAAVLAVFTDRFFSAANLTDLFLANVPVLVAALGATLVIVSGEIDISVGSAFAVCSIAAGLAAKAGLPVVAVAIVIVLIGAALGAMNGALVAFARVPSIVVTLATMVALRDGLRWATQGEWVQDLPASFQWLGQSQAAYPFAIGALAALLVALMAWSTRDLAAGRAVYAAGSNPVAARLAGLDVPLVKFSVFMLAGALTAVAAVINAARFTQVPSNSGLGLEMKVIAAAVVGGAAIRGGRATLTGTVLGVVLLGVIGPALTFLGVNAYWERAIQGAIILGACLNNGDTLLVGRLRRQKRQWS